MIQARGLGIQFGGQRLFSDLSFNIGKGERVGLVGRNGSGKSTLFKLILGKLAPDEGEVSIPSGYRLGELEQHISFSQDTVMKECSLALPEESKFDFHKVEKILFGLGFDGSDLEKDPASFSGGFQIRINLCKALLSEPDMLLLDEPTNYLDIVSQRWLRGFLKNFPGEILLITHDRSFMDSVASHIMGIHRAGLKKLKGDTEKYYQQLALEEEIYEKTRANHERKKEHLESFVERFRAKASKAAQAQSKLKQLEKMGNMEELQAQASMGLRFRYKECRAKELLSLRGASFAYPGAKPLFSDFDLLIGPKDRIGIIGKNGKGKSTLLNILAGELRSSSGEEKRHPSLELGHFGQTNVSRLSPELTVEEEVRSANPAMGASESASICAALMFEGDLARKKVKVLSGGERSRTLLAKIVARPCNLLLLDEPTNHLDMESIEALAEEVANFPGAVAVVSHDETFLRKTVNRFVVFRRGEAQIFNGSYDEFLEKNGWDEEDLDTARSKSAERQTGLNRKELRALRQEAVRERAKAKRPLVAEQEDLETNILDWEAEMELEQRRLESATEAGDGALILESSRRVGELEKCVQSAFERLEELESLVLEIEKEFDQKLEQLEN